MRLADVLVSFSRLRPEVQACFFFALAGIASAALVVASSGMSRAVRIHH